MAKHRWLSVALLAALSAVSWSAPGAQIVVVDAEYTHGPDTTKDSHFYVVVPPGTPTNWESPVNFAGGQAVVELEVKTKPSNAQTRFQVCFISKPDYSCTDQSPVYEQTGTVTWATDFSDFYVGNNGSVDWSLGAKDISLILKDTHNVKPAPENVGDQTAALYMPTDLHVTVTLVPEGETYVPPLTDPGLGGSAGVAGSSGSGGAAQAGMPGGGAGGMSPGSGGAGAGGAPAIPSPEPVLPNAGSAPAAGSAPIVPTAPAAPESLDEGCACRLPHQDTPRALLVSLVAAAALVLRRRLAPNHTI
jgi:hypothetical protein